jgi:hypothetical protein
LTCLDSVLLPAVVDQAQADTSSALTEGSSDLRRLLADAVAAPDIPAFASAMSVLADRLQEHLAVEAALLCPHLAAFSESEQLLLASELELEAERLVRAHSKSDRGEDR